MFRCLYTYIIFNLSVNKKVFLIHTYFGYFLLDLVTLFSHFGYKYFLVVATLLPTSSLFQGSFEWNLKDLLWGTVLQILTLIACSEFKSNYVPIVQMFMPWSPWWLLCRSCIISSCSASIFWQKTSVIGRSLLNLTWNERHLWLRLLAICGVSYSNG